MIVYNVIGIIMIVYSVLVTVLRFFFPDKLSKYKIFKQKYGEKTGVVIHVIAYTLLPLILGLFFLLYV